MTHRRTDQPTDRSTNRPTIGHEGTKLGDWVGDGVREEVGYSDAQHIVIQFLFLLIRSILRFPPSSLAVLYCHWLSQKMLWMFEFGNKTARSMIVVLLHLIEEKMTFCGFDPGTAPITSQVV